MFNFIINNCLYSWHSTLVVSSIYQKHDAEFYILLQAIKLSKSKTLLLPKPRIFIFLNDCVTGDNS